MHEFDMGLIHVTLKNVLDKGEKIMYSRLIDCYDVYADNCFIQRIHYFGLVQIIEKRLIDKGHVVNIIGRYLKTE
jgi:hypothetical protein